MSIPFVHLHLHSHYSILDGMGKIEDYIARAMELDMPAMALTDHGVMYGIKDFLDSVKKAEKKTGKKLKPIVGCEVYVAPESRLIKKAYPDKRSAYHLILLAKNLVGYHNLMRLSSLGFTEGFYNRPRVDHELIQKYHEGLICCSACLAGEIPQAILKGNIEEARQTALWYKNIFGEDFYFEIQNHNCKVPGQDNIVFEEQQRVNPVLYALSEELGIKCVATNDCHFVKKEDGPAHDLFICINTASKLTDQNRLHYTQEEYMKSGDEMAELNYGHPEVIANTLEIADKVERYEIDIKHILPHFDIPEEFADSNEYLKHLVYEGARKRYGENILPSVKERIDFELDTIRKMGFPDYFLIVHDFINHARSEGIWVGPGRGSAAGSVVAYCLTITNMDPIKYDLLFERFLNPDRISMPDIDIDFEEERRGEVYEYVEKKYGKDHVSHVVTFGTMATKQAIKDVARIEDLPLPISNKLAGMVPTRSFQEDVKTKDKDGKEVVETKDYKPNFTNCLKFVEDFRKEYEDSPDPKIKETLHFARELEGTIRQTGVHACAVIIGPHNLMEHIPVSVAKGVEGWISQYEGTRIEDVGMLKMDFLGLRTLSILKETLENIRKHTGKQLDIDSVPLDDKATFKLFGRGDTVATFQFESPGMQKWLRDLHPSRFEDLIAMNALYRPGPMQYIPKFVARKTGKEAITYELPEMEEILSDTYGVTVYQEQVMLLSQKLAKFTKGQADTLRKAMGKKNLEKMQELEEKFLANGVENGFSKEILQKIWNDWKEFAKYAFNKSHSTCYAWVGYLTGYFKAHYPAEFMAANLTKNSTDTKEITVLMDECKRMGLSVLGPDVNEGGVNATVTAKGGIRFGLAAIKGLGTQVAEDIVKNAPYKDIYDFVERASRQNMNRKTLESLIYAGAFDSSFPEIRRDQYFMPNTKGEIFLDSLIRYSQDFGSIDSSIESLFGDQDEGFQLKKPEIPARQGEMNLVEFLKKERELVGMYISSHPLDVYRFELENFCSVSPGELSQLIKQASGMQLDENQDYFTGGLVTNVNERLSKNGRPFVDFTLEDFSSSMDFRLFGKTHEQSIGYIKDGSAVFMKLKIKKRFNDETYEPRIESIRFLANIKETALKSLELIIPAQKITKEFRTDLMKLIKENHASRNSEGVGKTPVKMKIVEKEKGFSLDYDTKFLVSVDNNFLSQLMKMGVEYKGNVNTSVF
ncbi:MAG: DNA polymerase III subunit alpha [Bacteroidales bacterium]|nr:DNA polymerase III subunit alpha [Bacteroidales bacterium]